MVKELITSLGGNQVVADRMGVAPNAVANWIKRGIPWKRRHAIARMAAEHGVTLPADFWGQEAA